MSRMPVVVSEARSRGDEEQSTMRSRVELANAAGRI